MTVIPGQKICVTVKRLYSDIEEHFLVKGIGYTWIRENDNRERGTA